MQHLPKVPYAGRLCRIRADDGIDQAFRRISNDSGQEIQVLPIEGTRWGSFWLRSRVPLMQPPDNSKGEDGTYSYPFLLRAAGDRYIIVARDANLVEQLLERGGIGGQVDSPRVQVDRMARELVFPAPSESGSIVGRKYTMGALYGAVEGYARALRSISFFGDDLAEAELFRYALKQAIVTRIGLRDPTIDRELLNFSSAGAVDFHYRGASHLNAIDGLTSFMRASGYIEWRQGRSWAADTDQSQLKGPGRRSDS